MEAPKNEWLVCTNVPSYLMKGPGKDVNDYFFAYVDEEGAWWMELDASSNEEIDPPNWWMALKNNSQWNNTGEN